MKTFGGQQSTAFDSVVRFVFYDSSSSNWKSIFQTRQKIEVDATGVRQVRDRINVFGFIDCGLAPSNPAGCVCVNMTFAC